MATKKEWSPKWSHRTGDKQWESRAKYQKEDFVLLEKKDHIATITLNKPERLNSFNCSGGPEVESLLGAFADAEQDDDIKVIIIKGAGRCLSTGQDVDMLVTMYWGGPDECTPEAPRPNQRIRIRQDRISYQQWAPIAFSSKYTIAQIHGYCLGAALYFVELMDFIVAADDAVLAHTEQRWGPAGLPVPGFPWLLHRVGLTRAMDLMVSGRFVSGKEAAEMGWVTKAVPADELEEEVGRLANMISLYPADGIACAKGLQHIVYESMGFRSVMTAIPGYHALLSNMKYDKDEYNWLREKTKGGQGLHGIFAERDERFKEVEK